MELDILNFNNKPVTGTGVRRVELKRRTVVPFIIAFMLVNLVVALILNLYSMSHELESNYFFSADFRSNISQEDKEKVEKEILSNYSVKNVRYISKEKSFKDLQEQLGVAIPDAENSLSDSIMVYFRNRGDLAGLQEKMESMEQVKEAYADTIHMDSREEKSKFYKLMIVVVFGAILIPLVFLIIFIYYNGFSIEYLNKCDSSLSEKENLSRAKWTNFLPMVVSALIGTLLFLNIYLFFRDLLISELGNRYIILSLKEFIIPQLGVTCIICLLLLITPFWPSKKSGGDV